jgi:hypothetical protein
MQDGVVFHVIRNGESTGTGNNGTLVELGGRKCPFFTDVPSLYPWYPIDFHRVFCFSSVTEGSLVGNSTKS